MIVESHALWGEEPTEEYPATFTYLGAEPLPDKPNGRRPYLRRRCVYAYRSA